MSFIYRIMCFCVTHVSINIFTIPNWGFGITLFNFYFHLYGVSVDSLLSQRCAMVHYSFFDQPKTKFVKTRAICDRNIRLRDLRQMISRFDIMKRHQKRSLIMIHESPKTKLQMSYWSLWAYLMIRDVGLPQRPQIWPNIPCLKMKWSWKVFCLHSWWTDRRKDGWAVTYYNTSPLRRAYNTMGNDQEKEAMKLDTKYQNNWNGAVGFTTMHQWFLYPILDLWH